MSQEKQMEEELIKYIAGYIDHYIKSVYKCFPTKGLLGLEGDLFNELDCNEYIPNTNVYGTPFVTLPTDKREYYKLTEVVINYYLKKDHCPDLIIDFNNLFKDSEQLAHLYGRMKYPELKYQAILKYLANSTNLEHIETVKNCIKKGTY